VGNERNEIHKWDVSQIEVALEHFSTVEPPPFLGKQALSLVPVLSGTQWKPVEQLDVQLFQHRFCVVAVTGMAEHFSPVAQELVEVQVLGAGEMGTHR
jgi:hypothetical protein